MEAENHSNNWASSKSQKNRCGFLIIMCLSLLIIFNRCEEADKNKGGYSCISGDCVADFDNPQYLTLADCQSVCGNNNGDDPNTDPNVNSLNVAPSQLNFPNSAGNQTLQITANVAWQITSDQPSWCAVSTASGNGDATVNVTVTDNPTTANRVAKLSASNAQHGLKKEVTVTQAGTAPASITIDPTSKIIGAGAETINVTVSANVEFDVTSNAAWITVTQTTATAVILQAEANTATASRSGTVTFKQKNGNASATLTVNQEAAPTSQSIWTLKAYFPGGSRRSAVGFCIGDKGYIGLGSPDQLNFYSDFWEYNPVSNTWTQKANFAGTGTGRHGSVGFSIGSKGYVGLGNTSLTGNYQNDFWEYDPDANTWTRVADFEGGARSPAVGFSIDNKGYVGTGNSGSVFRQDFWEYDPPTNTWTQRPYFQGGTRSWAVGFSMEGKGYIGTGMDATGLHQDFWEYDPVTYLWTKKANVPGRARHYAVGFSIGSRGFIGTGTENTAQAVYLNDFWEYDPVRNTWTQRGIYGGGVEYGAVGFSIGSKGYVGTGYNNSNGRDFWEYTP